MSAIILTEDLTKTYGRRSRGIQDVSLKVNEGEVFGFLGPNGAGKTTTIRTLLGFMKPTSGRAEILGMDIRRRSVEIRASVGNLPGEFTLEDRMTGEQLIKLFARLRGVRSLDHAHELAERLDADLKRPMRRLSRGNKQKIGLVQAMFHKPPLLILDEPTGGLDPLVQEEFLRVIDEVRAEGRTVFFSSHNLPEVERICDRVGIIRDGRLTAVETTDDLVNKSFRHVSLTFAETIDDEEVRRFENLEGVEEFERDGAELSFELHENLDRMIKLAARHELVDMRYKRPSLEEIFLAYYGGEDTRGGRDETGAQKTPNRGGPNTSTNSSEAAVRTRVENASYHTNPVISQNGNEAAVGLALQKAVETIVEQTVERTVDKIIEKGEKS